MPDALLDFWDVWHQPLLGALHVLGLALFGGAVFSQAPTRRHWGVLWMLATGAALFLLNPARIAHSNAFRIKMALLVALLFVRGPRWLVLGLWVAVIFAARAIAYL
jgi:hypothetical protein